MATARKIFDQTVELAQRAKRVGVPADTLERFLRFGYVPQPKQLEFHAAARACDEPNGPTQVGFGGARGPGKSHAVLAQVALDDCQRVPGLKVLFLRKIQKNAREQFEDLRRTVLRHVPHDFASSVLRFANGSRLFLGHFHNEKDIDQYLGLEYDIIVPEEATTLSQTKYRALRDSNRTSKPGFRPRIYTTTNPGGVGHSWFKSTFITPARDRKETDTRFIFATIDDNRFIDPDYTKKLEENTGWRLQAYRYGNWDIAAGQFFTNWRHDLVVVPAASLRGMKASHGGFDYGFQHFTAAYPLNWSDGTLHVLGEYCERRKLPNAHSMALKEMSERKNLGRNWLSRLFAGADCFAARGDEDDAGNQIKSIATQYSAHGLKLLRANTDRVSRAAELLKLLGDDTTKAKVLPKIKIADDCVRLIECIPALQVDPKHPEKVLKWDMDGDGNGGDDPFDALSYGMLAPRMVGNIIATGQAKGW